MYLVKLKNTDNDKHQ